MQNQQHEGDAPNIARLRTHTRKMKRRATKRRMRFLLFLIAVAVFCVMFITPVFNIRAVNISGTEKITAEQLDGFVQSIKGENIFTADIKKLSQNIATLPYVKSVSVKRRIYPTSLDVNITERQPVAYIASAGGFILIDKECVVLEISMQPPENLANITGISPKNPTPGQGIDKNSAPEQGIDIDEENKSDIIQLCIKELAPIIDKVSDINLADVDNISFEYDNRLRVICGSTVDFAEKILLFQSSINSNRIEHNARGTFDLSITGKAVHIP